MLRFNDGDSFDVRGELRPEWHRDGWYVVGHNIMFAVDSIEEALSEIANLTAKENSAIIKEK
jgi:hypothetical protein